ncbi:MAG: prepilin-type N-terminal cleavage/methylation domain-containing protein [Candidatus Absconditabacterales bacterium]
MTRKLKAFTLIEMMIAITVFAIGVLAVLRVVMQDLVSMDRAQIRTMAAFLAKEGLELTYNIRDANIQKGLPRNCLLTDQNLSDIFNQIEPDKACAWYFSSGAQDHKVLQVGFTPVGYFIAQLVALSLDFAENFDTFRLSLFTGQYSGNDISRYAPGAGTTTGDVTFFGRYILFTGVREGNTILPLDSIVKVESHVLFIKGTNTGEIVLESFIGRQ